MRARSDEGTYQQKGLVSRFHEQVEVLDCSGKRLAECYGERIAPILCNNHKRVLRMVSKIGHTNG